MADNTAGLLKVRKGTLEGYILPTQKATYVTAGWQIVKDTVVAPTDPAVIAVANTGKSLDQATAHVAVNMKKPAPVQYNDGLIKPKAPVQPTVPVAPEPTTEVVEPTPSIEPAAPVQPVIDADGYDDDLIVPTKPKSKSKGK
jgi:hypothetical protein